MDNLRIITNRFGSVAGCPNCQLKKNLTIGYSKFQRDFKLPSISISTRFTSNEKKLEHYHFFTAPF